MSYKIKSTPFFQRLLSTSRRNGQLQQLKEEYERIREFNEPAIEKKLRQVRLKRLFNEIEDLKETNFKRRRLILPQDKQRAKASTDAQRLQNLLKAKEMGQHFSRCNGMGEVAGNAGPIAPSRFTFLSKRQEQERKQEEERRTKARVDNRTKYGNETSHRNIQKMLMDKLSTEVTEGMAQTSSVKRRRPSHRKGSQSSSETSINGKEKLRQRISYGNTISDLNMMLMSKSRKGRRYPNQCKQIHINAVTNENSTLVGTTLSNSSQPTEKEFQSCDEIQDQLLPDNGPQQPFDTSHPAAVRKSVKARMLWHKFATALKYPLDTCRSKRSLKTSEQDLEYQLRSISNETNLLQTLFTTERLEQLKLSESEDGEECEILMQMDCLYETKPSQRLAIPPHPPLPVLALGLKPIPKGPNTFTDEDIQSLIKKYEPRLTPVAERETKELSIDKLCVIFENHGI